MSVEKHIRQLLFEHDCVIIPQFGGFVGNYKPAKLDRITHKFSPPSKEISFNKNLVHNDGLLANRISTEEKKTYEEANSILKKYSEDLKSTLKNGKKIELPQIGILFSDEQRNILFEPDYSANYLINSFGLHSFHSPLLKKAEPKNEIHLREKTVELKFEDRKPIPEKKTISVKRTKKYLAYAAAALPLLALLFWIPFNLDKINHKAKSMNYSNLIPFAEKPAPLYSERKAFTVHNSQFTIENPLLSDTNAIASISLLENDETIVVRMKEISEELRIPNSRLRTKFHIIAGCFEYKENAEKLVNSLHEKGFDAKIIDKHKGLFRVEFQSFRTRKQAREALMEIRSTHNAAAWLLVK